MRSAAFIARRVTPSAWAHANRFSHTPRPCASRPCVPTLSVRGQRRRTHATSKLGDSELSSSNEQESATEPTQQRSAEPDRILENDQDDIRPVGPVKGVEQSPQRPATKGSQGEKQEKDEEDPSGKKTAKDYSWVYQYTGDRIQTIEGVGTEAYEEFLSHDSGTKLLCSWSVGHDDKPTIWVPGDAPRIRELVLPADLKPEKTKGASDEASNCVWSMGNPRASHEPFFASLAAMNPRANFDSTDVIAHSGILLTLMGIARGHFKQFPSSNVAMALHVTLVQNTLVIKRLTAPNKSSAGRGSSPTIHGSFLNKITQMKSYEEDISPDHYHALRYEVGPLRCVAIVPIDAATSDAALPPVTFHEKSLGISNGPGSANIRRGGRGVPPAAVTKIMTGVLDASKGGGNRISATGHLKFTVASRMAQIWFTRPVNIVQGHLGPAPPGAPEDSYRLSRVSVRTVKPILDHIEDIWQMEFRKMVTFVEQLKISARKAGGSCVITYQPPQKAGESSPTDVPGKFELYKCRPGMDPIILDWHVDKFWSKK
ncbi:unnamed protein product [Discula destructiva]